MITPEKKFVNKQKKALRGLPPGKPEEYRQGMSASLPRIRSSPGVHWSGWRRALEIYVNKCLNRCRSIRRPIGEKCRRELRAAW